MTTRPAYYQLDSYPSLLEEGKAQEPDSDLTKEAPALLLFVDINGTIFTQPTINAEERDQVILDLLAHTTCTVWQREIQRVISYSAYLKEYILPKEMDRKSRKSLYNMKLLEFFPKLEIAAPEICSKAKERFKVMQEALKTRQVFASFYHLIKELKRNKMVFSVIIRTHGSDGEVVKEEVERIYPGFFSFQGEVRGDKKLYIVNQGKKSMYNFFQDCLAIRNGIIQDTKDFPKKFPIQLDRRNFLPIFFDDRESVIQAYDPVTKTDIDTNVLIQRGHFYRVDTESAMTDPLYLFNMVRKSIALFKQRAPVRKSSVPLTPRRKRCCFLF